MKSAIAHDADASHAIERCEDRAHDIAVFVAPGHQQARGMAISRRRSRRRSQSSQAWHPEGLPAPRRILPCLDGVVGAFRDARNIAQFDIGRRADA